MQNKKDTRARLKKHVSGSKSDITHRENQLLKNDNEALGLDHEEPNSNKDQVEFKPQESSIAGHIYLNTIMGSFYINGDAE